MLSENFENPTEKMSKEANTSNVLLKYELIRYIIYSKTRLVASLYLRFVLHEKAIKMFHTMNRIITRYESK